MLKKRLRLSAYVASVSEKEIANLNTLSQYIGRLKVKLEQAVRIATKLRERKAHARAYSTLIGAVPDKYDTYKILVREQKLKYICEKGLRASETLIGQTIDAAKPLQPTPQFQKLITRLNATFSIAKAVLRVWGEDMTLWVERFSGVRFNTMERQDQLDREIEHKEDELKALLERLQEIEQDRTYLGDLMAQLKGPAAASAFFVASTGLFAGITGLGVPLLWTMGPLIITILGSLGSVLEFFSAFGEAKKIFIQRKGFIEGRA